MAGRVVADVAADGAGASGAAGLNECSVLLEGGREASGGARVRLDLHALPAFRLFPGQASASRAPAYQGWPQHHGRHERQTLIYQI